MIGELMKYLAGGVCMDFVGVNGGNTNNIVIMCAKQAEIRTLWLLNSSTEPSVALSL